ncbi:MAG: ATP-binding protein [Chloroflexi bacterium]|nr:ATP-binding protein [Chloroflexota bacterium]
MNRNGNGLHSTGLAWDDDDDAASPAAERLGMVVNGSLKDGLEVKLDPEVSVEAQGVQVGRYVVIEGQKQRFFGMITDVELKAIDDAFAVTPPAVEDSLVADVLRGTATYGLLHVLPTLSLPQETIRGAGKAELKPVRTIPAHYSPVAQASDDDVALIFGDASEVNFWVGSPLDMESKVCLDIATLITRSNAVFGKSGTGKSFLTRLLLAGVVQASNSGKLKQRAVNLIFDMHNDYGWEGSNEGTTRVKGLKQLFPNHFAVFTLDPARGREQYRIDEVIQISMQDIIPEDIVLLKQTLNLTDLMVAAAYDLSDVLGVDWVSRLLEEPTDVIKSLLDARNRKEVTSATVEALKRRMRGVRRLGFMTPKSDNSAVKKLIDLLTNGKNVVLEFGKFGNDQIAYVLVANLLTRRIHEKWVEMVEAAPGPEAGPPTLVITIEEAHKFLNPGVAEQTIFGIIAREMRKYRVTLLVVDQRPSGIDEEILSQIGTKLCCLLDNERDVDAVLAGVAGRNELREVLSKLETKQQSLIFGHAVPMPVVIKVCDWSQETYARFGPRGGRVAATGRDIL